jgi:hypothetical protein
MAAKYLSIPAINYGAGKMKREAAEATARLVVAMLCSGTNTTVVPPYYSQYN